MAEAKTIDRHGGTDAVAMPDGMIRLEIWTEDRLPTEDPLFFQLTPGQAMGLIERLSASAKRALSRSIE